MISWRWANFWPTSEDARVIASNRPSFRPIPAIPTITDHGESSSEEEDAEEEEKEK
jgi:hypothetical protein